MASLDLGGVPDGPVTLRVCAAEPFTFDVVDGLADVPEQHVAAVLAAFDGAAVASQTSTRSRGRRSTQTPPSPRSTD